MDEPTAQIVSIDGQVALLRVTSAIGCPRCAAGKGCGAGLLSGDPSPREFHAPLPSGRFAVGDEVRLTLQPTRLLQASVYAYGIPLLGLTSAPLLANWAFGPLGDAALVAVALAAVVVAVALGRRLLARNDCMERLVPGVASQASSIF